MDITGLLVQIRNLRNFPSFHVRPSIQNCPSAMGGVTFKFDIVINLSS
jgi:hypothetical protein